MSRIYRVSIPFVYRESEENSKVINQSFYFETDDCSPEKEKVINHLKELHEIEMGNDDDPYFIYQNEFLQMAKTVELCKDWPNVYEGMYSISTQIEIKGYGKHPLSVKRIRPVKL